MAWEAPSKAAEKDDVIQSIVMELAPPSEAWLALVKMAAETKDTPVIERINSWMTWKYVRTKMSESSLSGNR